METTCGGGGEAWPNAVRLEAIKKSKENTVCLHFISHTSLERQFLMTRMQADCLSFPDEFSCHAGWKSNLRIHPGSDRFVLHVNSSLGTRYRANHMTQFA